MTKIGLVATDQLLSIVLQPKVASGDQNSVALHVDLSDEWDGFGLQTATFYTSKDETVHEAVLTNGECIIPAEVLVEPCTLFIGIRGRRGSDDAVKTSSLVKYRIAQGAPGTTVEPSPDVYQQLLVAYGDMASAIETGTWTPSVFNGGADVTADWVVHLADYLKIGSYCFFRAVLYSKTYQPSGFTMSEVTLPFRRATGDYQNFPHVTSVGVLLANAKKGTPVITGNNLSLGQITAPTPGDDVIIEGWYRVEG